MQQRGFHQCLTRTHPLPAHHLFPPAALRCYVHALKLMPEAPGLWNDLGLNYHRQASLPGPAEGEDDSSQAQALLLEKAQQVRGRDSAGEGAGPSR